MKAKSTSSIAFFGAASAVLCLIFSVTGFAGEILRLKTGDVAIQDRSEEILKASLSHESEVRTFIVQFADRISGDDERKLADFGVQIRKYLPDDALIVRAPLLKAALVSASVQGVRAVVPFEPEWKISPELKAGRNSSPKQRVVISAIEPAQIEQLARYMRVLQGITSVPFTGSDLVTAVNAAQITQIAMLDAVEWIETAPAIRPLHFEVTASPAGIGATATPPAPTGYESGTKVMNFEAAWNRGYKGEGQIVAVADTGLDTGNVETLHSDFKVSFKKGLPVGLGTKTWEDSMGHGTHVSGSVSGDGSLSNGLLKGGAYEAKLVMEGLWSPILDNLAPGTDFNKIIGSGYNEGARIHTNSWGSPQNPGAYDVMASRVDEYTWNHQDILVLFAAGNDGADLNQDGIIDEGSIGTPATAKNVLSVGASENYLLEGGIQKKAKELRDGDKKWAVEPVASTKLSDTPNGLAIFSSRGPTKDGRIKPEIVAPGTNIVSTRSHHPKAQLLWGEYDANYVYSGGTSMATPLTAGAAAVAREYLVKARGFQNPSGALVKATLIHTAMDLYPGQYGEGPKREIRTRRPNVQEGFGRVDMDQVTSLGEETAIVDDVNGVGLKEQRTVNLTVRDGGSLRATLVYTDAPAASSAAKALVNDLSLQVVKPNGEMVERNDHINNSRMIELTRLPAGEYKVIVSGMNVPQGKNGKQPYALLVTPQ